MGARPEAKAGRRTGGRDVATFKINDMMVTMLPPTVECGLKEWGHNSRNNASPNCANSKDACCEGQQGSKPTSIDQVEPAHLERLRQHLHAALAALPPPVGGRTPPKP
jgi:hypothetical protein